VEVLVKAPADPPRGDAVNDIPSEAKTPPVGRRSLLAVAATMAGTAALAPLDAATHVQTLVIPAVGHWVAEQAPQEMLAALTTFLAPYHAAAASRSPS
jgi:pimeloyl-ACP methyl ester carboxylesterase